MINSYSLEREGGAVTRSGPDVFATVADPLADGQVPTSTFSKVHSRGSNASHSTMKIKLPSSRPHTHSIPEGEMCSPESARPRACEVRAEGASGQSEMLSSPASQYRLEKHSKRLPIPARENIRRSCKRRGNKSPSDVPSHDSLRVECFAPEGMVLMKDWVVARDSEVLERYDGNVDIGKRRQVTDDCKGCKDGSDHRRV